MTLNDITRLECVHLFVPLSITRVCKDSQLLRNVNISSLLMSVHGSCDKAI